MNTSHTISIDLDYGRLQVHVVDNRIDWTPPAFEEDFVLKLLRDRAATYDARLAAVNLAIEAIRQTQLRREYNLKPI